MVHYSGINHLALITPDMDTTVRYWRVLLGMKLIAGHIDLNIYPGEWKIKAP